MNRSMKKNLFFGLMALAGLFTSCSQDDTDASPTADSNQVSMSIGMPADFVKTRASAPATFPAGHTLRCILEVWTKDGSTRRVRQEQLVTAGAANITFSFELADQGAGYVKLRSLSLGYSLPSGICRQIRLNSLNLKLQVNNLFTWCKAGSDIDPESYGLNSGTRGMASPKTYSIGLSTSF